VLRRLGAIAKTDAPGVTLEVRSQLTQLITGDPMLRLDRSPLAIDLLGGAALDALGGRAELFGGANIQRDGAVPRAAAAYSRTVSRAQLRLEAALHELAPESAVLLAEAMRTRAGGSVALGWPRFYARAAQAPSGARGRRARGPGSPTAPRAPSSSASMRGSPTPRSTSA
jgi:hypothetical protein